MTFVLGSVGVVQGATSIDQSKQEIDLVKEYCVGLPRTPADAAPTQHVGVVIPGQLPTHLRKLGVQNIWKLQGQAWGPLTGVVHFGPLNWGGKTHHVIAYRDANHPIAELRDVMIFEGFAWGENVGWINMNTAQYFCNNTTSYEQFGVPGTSFRDALEMMAQVNSPAVPATAPSEEVTYISANRNIWEDLYDTGHYYLFGTLEAYNAGMSGKNLWNTVQNAVGRKLYDTLGGYQVSLIINAPKIGEGEAAKKAFVETGSFVFRDGDEDVIPNLSSLGAYESRYGKTSTTYRVWVEGQAWSSRLGALSSPNPACLGGPHQTECWEKTPSTVTVTGGQVDTDVIPGGMGEQPPLQIVPLVQRGSTGPQYDQNKAGQFVGALWSTRLGWMYFPEVTFNNEGTALKNGVMFMKVEEGDVCPVPYVDRRSVHYTGTKQSFEVNVGVLVRAQAGEAMLAQKTVKFWLPHVVGEKDQKTVNGWVVKQKEEVSDPRNITFESNNIPFQITCAEGFTCILTDGAGDFASSMTIIKDAAPAIDHMFTDETAKLLITVNPNNPDFIEQKGFIFPFQTAPVSKAEWPTSCFDGTDEPTPTRNGICTESSPPLDLCPKGNPPLKIIPVAMCAVGNLRIAGAGDMCTDSGKPKVDISLYTQKHTELGVSNDPSGKNRVTYRMELYDLTPAIGGANTGLVAVVENLLNDSVVRDASEEDQKFDFNKYMRIPLHNLSWKSVNTEGIPIGSNYELKPGKQYKLLVSTRVQEISGQLPIPEMDTILDFTTGECSVGDLSIFTPSSGDKYTVPTGADFSTTSPIIPVIVEPVYIGFGEVESTREKNSTGLEGGNSKRAVYKNKIYIAPHPLPLPKSYREVFTDIDGTPKQITSPVKLGVNSTTGDIYRTRLTKINYYLYRAEVNSAGTFVEGTEKLLKNGTNTSWERLISNPKVGSPLLGTGGEREDPIIKMDFIAGDGGYASDGTWSVVEAKGLLSPRTSNFANDGGRRFLIEDLEIEDGKSYAYFVVADPTYEVWERNLLLSDETLTPLSNGAKGIIVPDRLTKRELSLTNNRGIHPTGSYSDRYLCGPSYGYGSSTWNSLWYEGATQATCFPSGGGSALETVDIPSNELSFVIFFPNRINDFVETIVRPVGNEGLIASALDKLRVRNIQDYQQMSATFDPTKRGLIPFGGAVPQIKARYQLVNIRSGQGGFIMGAKFGFGRGQRSDSLANFSSSLSQWNKNRNKSDIVKYQTVSLASSTRVSIPAMRVNEWNFGRIHEGQLLASGKYAVIPRIYYDAVFQNVVASKSLHANASSIMALGTEDDGFLDAFSTSTTGTYTAFVEKFLKEPVWDISNERRSTPRPIIGMSSIVTIPTIAQGLKAQVSTVSFAPGSGTAPIECYPGATDPECAKRTMTYSEFETLVRGTTTTTSTTPSIADSCTNKDGSGTESAEECSTGGFVMAGAPVEITVFDIRDDQCNYVRGRDDVFDPTSPTTPPTTEEGYHVRIDSDAVSYMYYWGGTSNPEFSAQSCGTQFGSPSPDCMKIPVLLSLAPDYYANRTCTSSETGDPKGNNCVNIDYSSVYQAGNTASYQPIKVFVVGYDLLKELQNASNDAAIGKYAPIYTGRWSLEMNGIRFTHAGSMVLDNQRVFFTVKPSVPVFTKEEMVEGVDRTGGLPTDPTSIGYIKHSQEDYSKMALWKLDTTTLNGWKQLDISRNIPARAFTPAGATSTTLLNEFTDVIQSDLRADTGYKPIADGNSGYAVLLDLRDRFGNRLPAYDSSYAPTADGSGINGFVNSIKDTVEISAFLKKEDATLDANPIATEQISKNNDNVKNKTNSSNITSNEVFGALQLLPVLSRGGGIGTLTEFAQRDKFTLGSVSAAAMSYLNNIENITDNIRKRDESYLSPLHMLRLVSIAPTLDNRNGSFDQVRWTDARNNESPVVSLSQFTMVDATSGKTVTVGSAGGDILKFDGDTVCTGGTGVDCFKPKVEQGKEGSRLLSATVTLPSISAFGAENNTTFRRDVRFFPALEVGCSLNGKDARTVGNKDTSCGLYHLDPLLGSDNRETIPQYEINQGEFQLSTDRTERFLAVLRTNLTDQNLDIRDIELNIEVQTGDDNRIRVEDMYVEKICNLRTESDCDIVTNQNSVAIGYDSSTSGDGTALMYVFGNANRESNRTNYTYEGAYSSDHGLASRVLSVLSGDRWTWSATSMRTTITTLAESFVPTALYKLYQQNTNKFIGTTSGPQIEDATEKLDTGDVLLIRFAGTPRLLAGSTTASGGTTSGALVNARLLYRVGNDSQINGLPLDTTNSQYPMTAHYSETFRGTLRPDDGTDTTTTCQIDVRGRVRTGTFTNIIGGAMEVALSGGMDTYLNMMKTVIDRNVAEFLRNVRTGTTVDPNENGSAFVVSTSGTSKTFDVSSDVINGTDNPGLISNNRVVYIKNRNLVLGSTPGDVLRFPTSTRNNTTNPMPITFVVDGGDVIIKANMVYETCGSSTDCVEPQIGFIVRQQPNGNGFRGGNIFVDPEVTNVRGVFYAEGSMMTAMDRSSDEIEQCRGKDKQINRIEDCEIFDGFAYTNQGLANQLYIKGVVISRNTIGGSDKDIPELPIPVINSVFRPSDYLRIWVPEEISTKNLQQEISSNDVSTAYTSFAPTSERPSGSLTTTTRRYWTQRYDFNKLRVCGLEQNSSLPDSKGLSPDVKRFNGATWNDTSGNWNSPVAGLVEPTRSSTNPFPNVVFEYDAAIQSNTPPGFAVPDTLRLE